MIRADAAFAGIVRETADLGAAVQGHDRVLAQRSVTHRADVQDAGLVRLLAVDPADGHPQGFGQDMRRAQRMIDPFVADIIQVLLRAEGQRIEYALGALINQGTVLAVIGPPGGIAFDKVLINFRTNLFKKVTKMTEDGIIAQDRVTVLEKVVRPQRQQWSEDEQRPQQRRVVKGRQNGMQNHQRGKDQKDFTHRLAFLRLRSRRPRLQTIRQKPVGRCI